MPDVMSGFFRSILKLWANGFKLRKVSAIYLQVSPVLVII